MKCLQCGKEFEAVRSTAKFDSAKCRVEYSRVSVTVSVTEDVSVTSELDDNWGGRRRVFTPAWQRSGISSKKAALDALVV